MTPSELWPLLDDARQPAAPPTVLVCASRRLAQAWLGEDAERQLAAGRKSWLAAPIASFDAFVHALHEKGDGRAVLSAAQEAALWRSIIDAEPAERPLLRVEESARLAMEAWRLAQEWRLSLPFADCNGDVAQFNRWSEEFRRRLKRINAIDAASLPSWVSLQADKLKLPKRLVLAGFDDPTPAQTSLFSAMRKAGCDIVELAATRRRGETRVVAAVDREREIRAAASWARAHLERNGKARIGIVVPDLRAQRGDLERVLDEVLGCCGSGFSRTLSPRPYNLALGEPLADVGLVRCALRLLAARDETLSIDDATALLLSPYWGGSEEEFFQRAELDRWLREDGFLESTLQDWVRIAQRRSLTLVAGRLNALIDLSREKLPAKLSASAWTQHFSQWLVAAGWPGPRTSDSDEFQALAAWNELLAEYGALSAVLPSLTATAALPPLREAATRRRFQPRTPAVPIQVLSALDAGGLQFDHLWCLGLDDEHWPPPARPHPFIPFALQRVEKLPRNSGAHQTAMAQRVLDRFRVAADEIVLSYPQREDDLPLAASPLLAGDAARGSAFTLTDDDATTAWPSRWQDLLASARIERIDDAHDPLVHTASAMRGGTSVFKNQAICAFRGYARHRLAAKPLEEPGFGPTTLDRGNMVHKTMEQLWRRLESQARFLALDERELRDIVADAVGHGVQYVATRAPQRLGPAMIDLERRRLATLVHAWLATERMREPFTVLEIEGRVLGEERAEQRMANVAGIEVTLRPDRVDVLDSGEHVVLDYKTGKAAMPAPWYDDRPDEPQLLIYGLQQPRLGGLAFAVLRAGKVVFKGVSGPAAIGDGFRDESASSWANLQKKWDRELALLGEEIRSGFAGVKPKTLKACALCGLQALCHIRDLEPEPAE